MEGRGWRVEGGRWRVKGGGWRVQNRDGAAGRLGGSGSNQTASREAAGTTALGVSMESMHLGHWLSAELMAAPTGFLPSYTLL